MMRWPDINSKLSLSDPAAYRDTGASTNWLTLSNNLILLSAFLSAANKNLCFYRSLYICVLPCNVCVVCFVLIVAWWKLTGLASPKQRSDGEPVLGFSQSPGKKLDTWYLCWQTETKIYVFKACLKILI